MVGCEKNKGGKMMVSPSVMKSKILRNIDLLQEVLDGLEGKPFSWGSTGSQYWVPRLAGMGITLVTKNRIKRLGCRLKRGAQPVGSVYFNSPISNQCDLYVLECQCVEKNILDHLNDDNLEEE